MAKILIVEDETDIAEHLALFFQSQGFEAVHVDDGALVVDAVKREQPSLIVLDLMLPNKDGIACCKDIRTFSNVPIVMLTARGEQVHKLAGLEVGADDYVCKPFDTVELVLRVKAILRRSDGHVSYQAWQLDDQSHDVRFRELHIALSSLEYALFSLLFRAPERIFSREQILELAYPDYRDITDRSVDSHVKNIRKKFKQVGIAPSPIQSVYGAGYRFSPQ